MIKCFLKISLLFFALNTSAQTSQNDTLFKICREDIDSTGKYFLFFPTCGFVNKKGDTIIPLGKYAQCWEDYFVGNFTIVCLNDPQVKSLATAIDRDGNILFDVYVFGGDFSVDWLEDGMIRIVQDNKIGYANAKGEIVIKPQYDCAGQFENGKAKVTFDCKLEYFDIEHTKEISDSWFYIDKNGNLLK